MAGLLLGKEVDLLIDPATAQAIFIGLVGGVLTVVAILIVAAVKKRRNRPPD
jgi:hypothetical protein